MYEWSFTSNIKIKMKNTIICETTLAAAAPLTPMPNPNPPYSSKSKIKIGSKIIFNIVPMAATITGNFISPSPANIDLNTIEKTINIIP